MMRFLYLLIAAVPALAFAHGAGMHARAAGGAPVAAKADAATDNVVTLASDKIAPPASLATLPESAAATEAPLANAAPPAPSGETAKPTDQQTAEKPADGAAIAAPVDVIVAPVKRVMPKPVLLHASPKPNPKALTEKDAKPATGITAGAKKPFSR